VATGDVIVVRYADDLVVGFENRTEAERFLEAFRDRLAKFGLQLHPEKTRLIEFGRFAAQDREKRGEGKPETFTFLGFTHYCGKRRSNGAFTVWRKTAKRRMVAKLQAIKAELRRRMHEPIADVGAWLRKVVTGYYRYHAIPGNIDRLSVFGQRLRRFTSAQSTTRVVGSGRPCLPAADSSSPRSASLSYSSLPRYSSKVGAVCVEALVRICAGRDQR
jgi:RNA-directed DNA polymerase